MNCMSTDDSEMLARKAIVNFIGEVGKSSFKTMAHLRTEAWRENKKLLLMFFCCFLDVAVEF
jgi:hypothetical protein